MQVLLGVSGVNQCRCGPYERVTEAVPDTSFLWYRRPCLTLNDAMIRHGNEKRRINDKGRTYSLRSAPTLRKDLLLCQCTGHSVYRTNLQDRAYFHML